MSNACAVCGTMWTGSPNGLSLACQRCANSIGVPTTPKNWAHICGDARGLYTFLAEGQDCDQCGVTFAHAKSVAVYPVERSNACCWAYPPVAEPISAAAALRSLDHHRQAHAAAFLGVPAPPVPSVTIVAEPAARPVCSHRECDEAATHTTCDPVDAVVCEAHKCRCSKPIGAHMTGSRKCPPTEPAAKPETDGEWAARVACEVHEEIRVDGLAESAAIAAAFPTRSGRHDLYAEAMRLVGERHDKGDLVDLVTWLLLRIEEAEKKR